MVKYRVVTSHKLAVRTIWKVIMKLQILLYGRIDESFTTGDTIVVDVIDNWPAEDFGGKKSLYITTTNWQGGNNMVVGGFLLIRQVRACKTQSEEKAVVARECAVIRQSFKDGDPDHRSRNVAKLVYIHMLGYPTHFGQMDCLKLIASAKYAEKRVGYLGLTQLLDENSELLMLVTNSIKNDLNSKNQYVTGLALCALANIGSTEMCMSLSREVGRRRSCGNPYVQKKAVLCALRIVRKVRAHAGSSGSHGVLLSALSLIDYLLKTNPEVYRQELAYVQPTLVKLLRSLTISGYGNSQEYDAGGITDPFLQVKILRTLRLLTNLNQPLPEDVSDVLAQVATNTEAVKNAGNAVLYECVRTIVYVGPVADPSLRVLGINILGRFLTHKDNNVKYVALEALKGLVSVDIGAVQEHRSVILSCLTDPDISLRRRALDVAYSLINEDNVKQMTNEFLNYLIVTDADFRADLVSCICNMARKYAPSRRWQIDTLIKVMLLAGSSVPGSVLSLVCTAIASSPPLHNYAVHKLYFAMLVEAALWAIGEYGDLLVDAKGVMGADGKEIDITNEDVIDLIEFVRIFRIYERLGS
ncbi:AP-1 complex subunit gamma-1, putative [Perkinsus marinus ATCC 50983]|uniref:AP-1 complex subunit gamma-1, putative n=1 Tax=Perkinsus marinus (strain ATCC 50983 / TXsc) TaxID=423536 RepID=C5L965_PERM5|nr:AP-1 complex subunit gamma-1, putative [Perkinsus marinus ATCC 50983]EER06713.1 AP-1 complex subunit gamma-1, putative [Perkinsus marinus ATCC 50983]|eukprot:XP_002774897.1 AP-1 complex subunit gamma-1, putative [Perkinsus marinus ATCC 50983]